MVIINQTETLQWNVVDFKYQTFRWLKRMGVTEIELHLHDAGVYLRVVQNEATCEEPTVQGHVITNDGSGSLPDMTVPELVEYVKEQFGEAYADSDVQVFLFSLLKAIEPAVHGPGICGPGSCVCRKL